MHLVDSVSREERINPPRRWVSNLCLEIWWRFNLKNSRWELSKVEEANKVDLAACWRDVVMNLEDKLKALGIDPNEEPIDITKTFEVWLIVGVLIACALVAVTFTLYRAALAGMVS